MEEQEPLLNVCISRGSPCRLQALLPELPNNGGIIGHTEASVTLTRLKERFSLGRDFLMFLSGQTISYTGDMLASMALQIILLNQGFSATQIALVGLAGTIPMMLFGAVAAAVVDRFRRRSVLIFCDTLRGLLTIYATMLAVRGTASLVAYLAWIAAMSATRAFYQPVTMAIVPALIAPDRLAQASAAQSIGMSIPGLVGPALAAFLLEVSGPWLAFSLDAMSFFISAAMIWRTHTRYEADLAHRGGASGAGIADGVRFFFRTPLALGLMATTIILNAVNAGSSVPTQVHIVRTLGGSAKNLGLIYTLGSACFLLTSTVIMTRRKWRGYGMMLISGMTFSGLILATSTLTASPLAASVVLGFNSLVGPLYGTAVNVLYQQITPSEVRGRVFAIRSLVAGAMAPVAQFLSGPAVDRFGSGAALVGLGSLLLMAATAGLLWPTMRRAGLTEPQRAAEGQPPAA